MTPRTDWSAAGFVYVMESGGYYKIGWSLQPPTRRAHIQSANPLPVTLIGVIEGSRTIEAEWHEAFADKRVRGEWFALTEEDVAHVLHESFGTDNLDHQQYDGVDEQPGEFDVA